MLATLQGARCKADWTKVSAPEATTTVACLHAGREHGDNGGLIDVFRSRIALNLWEAPCRWEELNVRAWLDILGRYGPMFPLGTSSTPASAHAGSSKQLATHSRLTVDLNGSKGAWPIRTTARPTLNSVRLRGCHISNHVRERVLTWGLEDDDKQTSQAGLPVSVCGCIQDYLPKDRS